MNAPLADRTGRMLDMLCPMHVSISSTGHIRHVGPTLQKLRPETTFVGRRFMEVFALKRPRSVRSMRDMWAEEGQKLHLKFRDAPATEFKGLLVHGGAPDLFVINLSFGISIVDVVRDYALTGSDFAPTDLAIEMLYLVEAKSSAMEALRRLNLRLRGAKIAAEEQAFTDTLTGLKNRRAVDHVLARHLDRDQRFAVMQVDLDWFKAVNDSLGHAAGDHVLQTVARVLVEETREEDTVARIGGDEFVIVLPGVRSETQLAKIGQRIVRRLNEPIPFDGKECRISASIGIARFVPEAGADSAGLLHEADLALYASKRAGRGCVTFFSDDLRQGGSDVLQQPDA